jgi:hypothetical protein
VGTDIGKVVPLLVAVGGLEAGMKLNLKPGEHVRIEHDGGLGFAVHVEGDHVHIRAKERDEPANQQTTLVLESSVQVDK